MPSAALLKFEGNLLVDVNRIIESHATLDSGGQGRRGLGHITRSGVLMLCAAWELYLEELLDEGARVLALRATSPHELPKPVQRELSKCVRNSKHELRPLALAADGWRAVYADHVAVCTASLNTPKSSNIDPLFKRLIGIERLSDAWTLGATAVNSFVSARGEIAHRGRDAGYVRIGRLQEYRVETIRTVLDTDNAVAEYLRANSRGKLPWRRRVPQ